MGATRDSDSLERTRSLLAPPSSTLRDSNNRLYLDIETAPNVSYTWGKYKQDVISFQRPSHLLSFAYKNRGRRTIGKTVSPKDPTNDKELCKELHRILSGADTVITHNGDRFDLKRARARFAINGLPPLRPLKSIDTLKIARKYFAFESNKLDDLGIFLGVGRKIKTGGAVYG